MTQYREKYCNCFRSKTMTKLGWVVRYDTKVHFMRDIFSLLRKFDTFAQKVPGSNPGQDNLLPMILGFRFDFNLFISSNYHGLEVFTAILRHKIDQFKPKNVALPGIRTRDLVGKSKTLSAFTTY